MFAHILHPNSLFIADEAAFNHALSIAIQFKSHLNILHVDDLTQKRSAWNQFPGVREKLISWQRLSIDAQQKDVFDQLGVTIEKIETRRSNPVEAILTFQKKKETDLIVLSNGGRQGLLRWITPSVSETVIRQSGIPCLIVPESCRGFVDDSSGTINFRQILIPVADKPDFRPALSFVSELCEAVGVSEENLEIACLHVGEDFYQSEKPTNVECEPGDIAEVICRRAEHAELIIMISEGRKNLLDTLKGSTTEQVVRQAPCPVLIFPV